MKLISWNVNGLRAILKKNFLDFINTVKPDVLGIQEIKMGQAAIEKENLEFPGYEIYWNPAERPGYSGTAVLVKSGKYKVESARLGLGNEKFDREGRVQTLEFEKFYFVNCYFPNANHELSRLKYKEEFNAEFLKYIKKLEKTKPVVACADYNVAHKEIDLARPKENVGNPGFTLEERRDMDNFLKSGLVDTFRHYYPKKIQYTWWSYRMRAREKNIGWRIDYFLVSKIFMKQVSDAYIMDNVLGSDHCPVGINLRNF